jgi:hypothetical protein
VTPDDKATASTLPIWQLPENMQKSPIKWVKLLSYIPCTTCQAIGFREGSQNMRYFFFAEQIPVRQLPIKKRKQ